MTGGETTIGFAPMLPWALLAAVAGAAVLLMLHGLRRKARGLAWRSCFLSTLLLALANPTLVVEERDYLPNVAVVVMDESMSQSVGVRAARSQAALAHIRDSVAEMDGIELRVVQAGKAVSEQAPGRPRDGTHLFADLDRALSDIPRNRVAGVVMITDGQVHDVPEQKLPGLGDRYPLHVLLSGDRGERDRRLILKQAPGYGIVGKQLTMTVRVEDIAAAGALKAGGETRVTIRRDGELWKTAIAPVSENYTIEFELDHAGPTFFEIEADAGPNELTLDNNRAVAVVNGVRDRLRVLLISGEPHPGERTWRNLLKADPSVDLVHFTILRPPEKQDRTPVSELSLISFPVHELFDLKLYDFDLIIFDRYRRRGVLLNRYLENIAQFVDKGGALLVAVGPTFADGFSLFNTPLGRALPGRPTGRVFLEGYRPAITATGQRHPVTAGLPGDPSRSVDKRWGRWFRQIDVDADRGATVMSGVGGKPLLILDRFGEGRVVQILSDHVWLWSRGFEDGGPQAELLRRTAHWLMKEPELEENDLKAVVRGGRLEITRRSLEPTDRPVEMASPSGETQQLTLQDGENGLATASLPIEETGVYRVRDGGRTTLAASGSLNPLEVANLITTDASLRPLQHASGGGMLWLADGGKPEIRSVKAGRSMTGAGRLGNQGWLGLRNDRDYVVTGVRETSLLPALLVLILGLAGLILAWRREGQ